MIWAWILLGIYGVGLIIGIIGFAMDTFSSDGSDEFKKTSARYLFLMPVWPLTLIFHGLKGVAKAWTIADLPAPQKKVRWKN